MSFMIQPFHQAIAAEPLPEEPVEEPAVAEDVREQAVPEESPPEEESPPPPSEPVVENSEEPASETGDLDVPEEIIIEEPSVPEVDETDTSSPEENDSSLGGSSEDAEEEVPEDTEEEASEEDENKEPVAEQVVKVESLVTEDNYFQFSKQSCIEVGNGSYHCTTKSSAEIDTQSVVYSENTDGGDSEIFLRTSKGKVKQLTDNSFDDTAPHYDAESMRVVWQRLIDGRQQIILFDIMEEREAQLTFSKTNNMEPKVSDAGIVWQAWDNNDWEIMLFDGSYTEQLTDNEAQDVAPVIQDGYVLWNVLGGDEQQARVYSLDTKETTSIQGYEGGSIINPRFVLVYDTQYENGDVITQSFDPATGLSEPIAAKPAPEPVNIPQTDPTGEIRALITNKSQKDEKELEELPTSDTSGTTTPSAEPGTLDLKLGDVQTDSHATTTAPAAEYTPIELTEYDLVIPESAFAEALEASESSTQ